MVNQRRKKWIIIAIFIFFIAAIITFLWILGNFDSFLSKSYTWYRLLENSTNGYIISKDGIKEPLTDKIHQVSFKRVECEGFKIPVEKCMEFIIKPPKGAILRFGYALIGIKKKPVGFNIRFRITALPLGGKELVTLFDNEVVSQDEYWKDCKLSLKQFGGRKILLRFESELPARKESERMSAFWLDPVIYTPNSPKTSYNVILVSIDALRADHLGCYGYSLPTSPSIDNIANQGVLFERAFAHTCWTLPSHITMLSSLPPEIHRIDVRKECIPESIEFLSEILRPKGYATAAFVGDGFVNPRYGWVQGFSQYHFYGKDTATDFNKALDWIKKNKDRPFFAFLHTLEVHRPYRPPKKYIKHFEKEYHGPLGDGIDKPEDIPKNYTAADIKHVIALYDAGIRSIDDYIQQLVDFLKENQLLSKTILVITADHGESLFEHGLYMKHISLNKEVIHVPLIILAPEIRAGLRSNNLAGIKDIVPTILELLGGNFIEERKKIYGRPLIQHKDFLTNPNKEIISLNDNRGQKEVSILESRYHYIVSLLTGKEQFYDLKTDPKEEHNLVLKSNPALKRFQKRALTFLDNFKVALLLDFPSNRTLMNVSGKINTNTIFLSMKALKREESIITKCSPDRKTIEFKVLPGPGEKMILLEIVDFNFTLDVELLINDKQADPRLIQIGKQKKRMKSSHFSIEVLESPTLTIFHNIPGASKKEKRQVISADDLFLPPEHLAEIDEYKNLPYAVRISLIRQNRLRVKEKLQMTEELIKELKSLGYLK